MYVDVASSLRVKDVKEARRLISLRSVLRNSLCLRVLVLVFSASLFYVVCGVLVCST